MSWTKLGAAVAAFAFWVSAVLAQGPAGGPGPQPPPSPWSVVGPSVVYDQGSVLLPRGVTGGDKGIGTINVSGGYYLNGNNIVSDTTPEIWLATGQSNFAVQRSLAWTPPVNAFVWNNSIGNCITTGTAFTALDPTLITPEDAFVADRALHFPNKKIYLIRVAYQGQPIAQWLPGAVDNCPSPGSLQDMYTKSLNNTVPALAAAGISKLTGILWWQGESDGLANSTTWISDFESVVTRYKTNSWYPSSASTVPNWIMFGIAGRIQKTTFATADAFNQTYILPAANNDPYFRMFVNTAAFPVAFWDTTVIPGHMTGQGYYEAGILASRSLYTNVPDGYVFFGGNSVPALNGTPPAAQCSQNAFACFNNNIVTPLVAPPPGTIAHLIQRDGLPNVITADAYAVGVGPTMIGRYAGGTALAPTFTPGGFITLQFGGQGYDGTGATTGFNTHSRMKFFTQNNQSNTDHSGAVVIGTTPPNSITTADTSWFTPSGGFHNGASLVDVPTGVIDAATGFRVNNAAASGNFLRGNGTNFVASAIQSGDLATLSYGTHITNSAGAASYNGSAASTIATDATNANTASTIVARDASGNFLAGTITAALTGHASSDCALTACTMTGNITFSPDTAGIAGSTSGTGAASGVVGETITATAGTQAMASGSLVNLITQSLGAGIWSVQCQNAFSFTSATTTMQALALGISTTSVTFGSDLNSFNFGANSTLTPDNGGVAGFTMNSPPTIVPLSGTTNVFCVGFISYGVSTAQSAGSRLKATRIH